MLSTSSAPTPPPPLLPPTYPAAELNVYCELHSCLVEPSVLAAVPHLKGIILSGGPASVYEEGAPHVKVGATVV
jgi:GMP synthase-like glutamine amidotransferase